MVPFCGEDSRAVHLIGRAGIIVRSKHIIMHLQANYYYGSRVVGDGWVSWLHSVVSGSGLHISVLSHVTTETADTYPASHWMVTMDFGNLLDTGFKGSVCRVGQHRTAA